LTLRGLARVKLLILDDWGLSPLTADQRRDLLEILEDRHGRGSTMITSQQSSRLGHPAVPRLPPVIFPTDLSIVIDNLVGDRSRWPLPR
jgi:hypothetical protein